MNAPAPAHSLFSPSAAKRWLTCPGSVMLTKDIPDTESAYANEGSCAHLVADMALTRNQSPYDFVGSVHFGVTVTDEMARFVDDYVDYVTSFDYEIRVPETKVSLEHFAPGQFGTSDFVVIINRTLHVFDLKYGRGLKVYARENPQALCYASGVLEHFDFIYDFDEVVIHIFQPRLDWIDVWETTVERVNRFAGEAKIAIQNALSESPTFQPDDEACQFCRAKATCAKRAEKNVEMAGLDFTDLMDPTTDLSQCEPTLDLLSPDDMVRLYAMADQFESWIKAIRADVEGRVLSGEKIQGYKAVEGRSIRKWADESKVAAKLKGDGYSDEQIFERSIIGITSAEKLVGKKNELFDPANNFVVKPAGKPTVVSESDPRPAIVASAEKDFADLIN